MSKIPELYFPDFIYTKRLRTFKAIKSKLAYPAAKPIGDEFVLKNCWERDIPFCAE